MPDYRKRPAPRSLRVADEIKKILGPLFDSVVRIPQVELLTVTKVELGRDLKNASVYVSLLNPDPDANAVLRELRSRKKEIRFHLASNIQTKYVPQLRFFIDTTVENAAKINLIIEDLHRDEPGA